MKTHNLRQEGLCYYFVHPRGSRGTTSIALKQTLPKLLIVLEHRNNEQVLEGKVAIKQTGTKLKIESCYLPAVTTIIQISPARGRKKRVLSLSYASTINSRGLEKVVRSH